MDNKNTKKDISSIVAIIIALLAIIAFMGGTFAYFTTTYDVPNEFKTKPYSTSVEETFVSPENWTPGTTTNKTIIATNEGDVDVAVRVSYTESWVSANNTTLPLTQNNNRVAIINFADDLASKWTTEGNYYYYYKKLTKNQSTSSFIKSVTFNSAVVNSANCTTNGNVRTCTSSGAGYDGATYTLTIKIETVQFDAYQTIWGTEVVINE